MADSSVAITPGSGVNVDSRTASNGDQRQVVVLGNDGDVVVGVEPFGALQTNTGARTLFYDEWGVSPIDTVDRWTVTGTTPTVAGGVMTMSATASTYNAIRTKDAVRPNVGYTLIRNGLTIETSAAVGAGRFVGLGTTATTPAAAVLAQDGIGFEIDQATGALLCVTYAAGVRTTIATLVAGSAPSGTGAVATSTVPAVRDGGIHAYEVYFRVTQAWWRIDGVPVATQSFPNVQVQGLPALIVRQNAASFTGTPTFTNIAHLTADTSAGNQVISDSVIGTRTARVTPNGALTVSPNSLLTAGTAAGNVFRARVAPSAITGSTALVAAPGTGLSIHLTDISVSNAGGTLNTVSLLDGATNVADVVAAASGGGGSMNFQTPIKCAAATALNYTTSAASLTYVTVTGYIA